jgi:rhamnose transport system ATP-binding protein
MTVNVVRVVNVSKSFGGVRALDGVDLEIATGEILALCGENGAGKSTLIRILAGYYAPDQGHVEIGGSALSPSVKNASERGVSVIYQESVACLDLNAVDNVFVGRELRRANGLTLDRARMRRQTAEILGELGEVVPLDEPLAALSMAQRQMIGIARALSQRCRLLILDEPTASLSVRETESLFRILRQLKEQGVAILYVSHRMEEIFLLADRVSVLRDGRCVAVKPIESVSRQSLIEMMVGREWTPLDVAPVPSAVESPVVLAVNDLGKQGEFADVSFEIRQGEIVGLGGLVGAGRSEVANAIFGTATYDVGSVELGGVALPKGSIADSIQRGLALTPEDRQHEGLILPMTATENLSLTTLRSHSRWGLIRKRAERQLALRLASEMNVRAARLSLPAEALSGGNQQKLALGKWLATKPRALILDEPTRGVDVAAKSEIHHRIYELARGGMATLVISSEMPELLRLCDRILVMREGRITGELSRGEASEQKILELALPVEGESSELVLRRGALRSGEPRFPYVSRFLQRREVWLGVLLAMVVAVVGVLKPSFASTANLRDVAAEASPAAIIASAVTLVVIAGEIDISVGSIAGIAAAILGLCCYGPTPLMSPAAGVGCALAAATGIGCLNGLLVTWGRVPSIIATLAMLTGLRGITKLIMGGSSIDGRPEALRQLATDASLGVPNSVWIAGGIVAMIAFIAARTPLGLRIYAVGSNAGAAPLLGISVGLTKFFVFAMSGLAAGMAAVLLAPKNAVIQPNLGEGLELLVITCVVVGGTSIRGGSGNVGGTLLAVLLLSLVPTALTYVGAPSEWRLAIQGAFILGAVLADHLYHRRSAPGRLP